MFVMPLVLREMKLEFLQEFSLPTRTKLHYSLAGWEVRSGFAALTDGKVGQRTVCFPPFLQDRTQSSRVPILSTTGRL